MTTDDTEVRRIITEQVEGWNRGDAPAWSANCEPSVGFTNILGMRWDTQAGFETRHAEMFSGVFANSQLMVEIERLQFPEPNLAIVELLTTLTGYRALPPGIRATAEGCLMTRMLEVLTKRDGRWRIAACHNTAVVRFPSTSS
ncbi:MAG: SgcJ/EcaC family oxidoreductase [Gemmatimonadaceae bacterium]